MLNPTEYWPSKPGRAGSPDLGWVWQSHSQHLPSVKWGGEAPGRPVAQIVPQWGRGAGRTLAGASGFTVFACVFAYYFIPFSQSPYYCFHFKIEKRGTQKGE